jgi:hypothetical protein
MRLVAVLAAVTVVASSCPTVGPARDPVELSIQLATRQSCGLLSGLDYDTGCLRAVYLRVVDQARALVFEECRVLEDIDVPRELRELVQRPTPLFEFATLSTQGIYTFEVRGLHDKGDIASPAELCANPANNEHWLFWGESAPVDLSLYDSATPPAPVIRIVLDCRDCTDGVGADQVFGCAGIVDDDAGTCGPAFPDSFCAPTVACAKGCDEDADCFEGARACIAGTCDVGVLTGELCSPCGGIIACGDGFVCVERPGQAPFCAAPCPATPPCPSGTKCNRVGNALELEG